MKFQMSQMQENVGVHMDNRKTGLVSWSMSFKCKNRPIISIQSGIMHVVTLPVSFSF